MLSLLVAKLIIIVGAEGRTAWSPAPRGSRAISALAQRFLLLHARPSIREEGNIIPHATVPKTDPVEELRRRVFKLGCDLEEPLDLALAFTRALDLMGYGLNGIGDDHGSSLLAVAEALTGQITTAKKTWRRLLAASRRRPPSCRTLRRGRTA